MAAGRLRNPVMNFVRPEKIFNFQQIQRGVLLILLIQSSGVLSRPSTVENIISVDTTSAISNQSVPASDGRVDDNLSGDNALKFLPHDVGPVKQELSSSPANSEHSFSLSQGGSGTNPNLDQNEASTTSNDHDNEDVGVDDENDTDDGDDDNEKVYDSVDDYGFDDVYDGNDDDYVWPEDQIIDSCGIHNQSCSPFYLSPCDNNTRRGVISYQGNCPGVNITKVKSEWKPCGEVDINGTITSGVCYCRNHSASCCPETKLDRIPKFDITVLNLNFTWNSLTEVTEETLRNVPDLEWLVLNLNNITSVSRTAFRNMTKLKRLEMAYNPTGSLLWTSKGIDPKNFSEAVNELNATLQHLDVNGTTFAYPSNTSKEPGISYLIRHLRLQNLRHLLTEEGKMTVFYMSHVHNLPNLCNLALASHGIRRLFCCSDKSWNDTLMELDFDEEGDVVTLYEERSEAHVPSCISKESRGSPFCVNFTLPTLQVLNLFNNTFLDVPNFCHNASKSSNNITAQSSLPNLRELSLAVNALVHPTSDHFQCMDKVHSLALAGNPLKYLQTRLFFEMKSLRSLDMRFTNVMITENDVFSHPTLTWLSIKSSNWFFDEYHNPCCILPGIFNNSKLEYVDLSYNVFSTTGDNKTNALLSPLAGTVTRLLMAEVGLVTIPRVITEKFTNLKVLGFTANWLTDVPKDTFQNMTKLEYVDLSANSIATVQNVDVFGDLLRNKHVKVNMETNPFSCTCDMLEFIKLYKSYKDPRPSKGHRRLPPGKGYFVGQNYWCHAPEKWYKRDLDKITLSIQNCLLTFEQEILIVVICGLIIFNLTVYIFLYRYRWQVRFWLYIIHVRLSNRKTPQQIRRRRARFSVFVSYCREDSNFVLTKVLPALERTRHLQLCIHERDYQPGRYITQNALEFMNQSQHILLVLSNAALKNEQCRFELFIAQKYALVSHQIRVTTLVLENLDNQLLDLQVAMLLGVYPCIQWPAEDALARPDLEETFWTRLGRTLPAQMPVVRRANRANRRRRPPPQRNNRR